MNSLIELDRPYKVGSKANRKDGTPNDIVLAFEGVSTQHALLTCLSEQVFLLEDEHSTNGTFVNDHQIVRKVCNRTDKVRLAHHPLNLEEVFPLAKVQQAMRAKYGIPEPAPEAKKNPNDFSAEFQELGTCYKTYRESKARLTKNQNIGALLRLAPGAVLGVLGLYLGGEHLGLTTLGSSVGGIFGMLLSNALSPAEKLAALEERFKIDYACPNPKCRVPLSQYSWPNLSVKTSCASCKAIWNT